MGCFFCYTIRMFTLIAVIIAVALLIYYVTTLDFEVGDGFTEVFKRAKKGDYTVVDHKQIEDSSKTSE